MTEDTGLKELTETAASLKDQIDEQEKQTKLLKGKFLEVTNNILKTLQLMDLTSVKGHGYNFYQETKESVRTPKTQAEKKALFNYLEDRGMFLEMASVNSQTLNKLYNTLAEEAAENGVFSFEIPGVGEPTSFTKLKMRKTK